jgi:GNAT superfamily N-acetyltransferase
MPLIIPAFEKLKLTPDLVIMDGHGLAHPRRIGIACHLGLFLGIPTIGCAKSRLVGTYNEPGNEPGKWSVLLDGVDVIGAVVRTRVNVKPVYVSPGHMITLNSAVDWVVACCRGYRLPEPTRMAHMAANGQLKKKRQNKKMENTIIRDITMEEVFQHFYKIAAEVECGNHFDFSNPHHEEYLRRKYTRFEFCGDRFLGTFLKDGTPVGYAILEVEEGLENKDNVFAGKTELLSIGIITEFQGKGYGKQLLEYAEEISRKTGAYTMYISTYAKDHEVIAFYGKNGYVPVATLPDVHGPGDEGMVYMRKILRKE